MDPKVWQMGMNAMNPNLYMGWMNAGMDPKSYGPTWSGWMANPMAGVPTAGAPVAMTPWTVPAAPAGTFNFFDPNAWMGMMAAPMGAMQPAPAPAK
ncbi:hypothetical protein EZJ19_02170 [Parasulfuritortus cantonensis]|uniref:Uncharacterized protein n=1 Tax=Parasulfuritortus cantonensis TaxID=2528202 RepID=A0A4R1BM52_9PROT|nr:hypothetical protein [Parasulfuritortus cantonensis]TCJ18541.1 hypothetical protein EZJ19_02170 [Parasulfuritortus cantonensis]